jgi:hypothetical protein
MFCALYDIYFRIVFTVFLYRCSGIKDVVVYAVFCFFVF